MTRGKLDRCGGRLQVCGEVDLIQVDADADRCVTECSVRCGDSLREDAAELAAGLARCGDNEIVRPAQIDDEA